CVICTDPVRESLAVQFPCAHHYDRTCFFKLVNEAMKDESLLPVRCCNREMPTSSLKKHLSANQFSAYERKLEEHQTQNRLYCPDPRCSRFLGSASEHKERRACAICGQNVCAHCKSKWHPFSRCSTDESEEEFLKVASDEKWQRCHRCKRMVELHTGCYHMTCFCKHEFCYVCGEQWKTCQCPQWDETRLLERAEEQVRVELGMDPFRPVVPQRQLQQQNAIHDAFNVRYGARVREAAARLRTNHECAHVSWCLRHGGGNCQSCSKYLDRYLLRCLSCQMLACVRCQRNRL
ncbi:hypothetical protein BT69DRAFT_1212834, partial [Atractiella rhizophila]